MEKHIIKFNVEQLAFGGGVSEDQVMRIFSDARAASPWVETRLANDFNLIYLGADNPKVDCRDKNGNRVNVRCLAKTSIKFQASKFIGSGRACTPENLESSILEADIYLVADLAEFPLVEVTTVPAEALVSAVISGQLKTHGWTRDKFKEFADTGSVTVGKRRNKKNTEPKKSSSPSNEHNPSTIRSWARSMKMDVSDRGRISNHVMSQYLESINQ